MFIVVKRSKIILAVILIAVLVLAGVLTYGGVTLSEKALAAKRLLPVYGVDRSDGAVALSFDAAWGSDKTEKILDILDAYHAKATFFLTGFWVDDNEDLVKEIASRGHTVANHSENHKHMNALSGTEKRSEIESVEEKIEAILGERPKFFRAPFGEYDDSLITLLGALKMQCVQWTVDSLDWKGLSGREIAERILSKVKSGSIVLCHNNSDHILEALPLVLLGLKNKGLRTVTMDEMIDSTDFSIDNNGILKSVG
ncbi:MAG: polysaccharide deacetylase family protein [Clostridia bacterium]|nr:polysaccharide deacetylase family protein [Clostridia bacterium]